MPHSGLWPLHHSLPTPKKLISSDTAVNSSSCSSSIGSSSFVGGVNISVTFNNASDYRANGLGLLHYITLEIF